MRVVLHLLSLLWLLLLSAVASAQITVDTARAVVGTSIALSVRIEPGATTWANPLRLSGRIRLSNPTVFFPQRFAAPAGDTVLNSALSAENDSTYTFSVMLRRDSAHRSAGDTLFYLIGEALAGSDSLCVLRFENLLLADMPSGDAIGAVIIRSIGPPLPYIRFATLEQNYPNPVPHATATTFAYRIDKRSDVRFIIYTMLGQELVIAQLGEQAIGPHLFIFRPDPTMPTGQYMVRLVTNSGSAVKMMQILR